MQVLLGEQDLMWPVHTERHWKVKKHFLYCDKIHHRSQGREQGLFWLPDPERVQSIMVGMVLGVCTSSSSSHGQPGSTEHRPEPGLVITFKGHHYILPPTRSHLLKDLQHSKQQLQARNQVLSRSMWGMMQTQPITVTHLLFSPGLLTLL